MRTTRVGNMAKQRRQYCEFENSSSDSEEENVFEFSSGSDDEWVPETRERVRRILVDLSDSDVEIGGPPEQEEEINSSDDEDEAANEIRSRGVSGSVGEDDTRMTSRDGNTLHYIH